jgi:hypothetical protein
VSRSAYLQHFAAYPELVAAADKVAFTESGCWQLPSARYAYRTVDGRQVRMHRLSLEITLGQPLGDLYARHKCDNPPCCNPEHLEPGTPSDNALDMVARGRHGRAHPAEKVREVRDLYQSGDWTFKALAEQFGTSIGAVSSWIRGERSDAGASIFRERPPIECGTFPGYQRHRRLRQKACEACNAARRAYRREKAYA